MTESGLHQMETWIREFPEHVRGITKLVRVDEARPRPRALVCIGMGGSAIGAQLVAGLVESSLEVPIVARSDVALPGFVGSEEVVVAVSYSGNTAETLTAARAAMSKGSRLICITSGGKLAEMAEQYGQDLVTLPGGISPRAALGYLFGAFFGVLDGLGLGVQLGDIDAATSGVGSKTDGYLSTSGPMAELAAALLDKIPIVLGCGRGGPIARRIRCQLNENSKLTAFNDLLPELNHNSVVGWSNNARQHPLAVLLVDEDVDSVSSTSLSLLETLFPEWYSITSTEGTPLGRMLDLIHQGDAISWHVARLRDLDPVPVDFIRQIKAAQEPS